MSITHARHDTIYYIFHSDSYRQETQRMRTAAQLHMFFTEYIHKELRARRMQVVIYIAKQLERSSHPFSAPHGIPAAVFRVKVSRRQDTASKSGINATRIITHTIYCSSRITLASALVRFCRMDNCANIVIFRVRKVNAYACRRQNALFIASQHLMSLWCLTSHCRSAK